ncbi:hypothetical protein GCM10010193_36940 [Kitasatospora atroaurantiaca]|uniref:PknH-like protein n=1 Tax=Kitasatospora atroaurantiaca TaxID=285545 RepID=A0A561ET28_9ACTN|nr:hypothetical protein [Kitasatospora atroaurantiaca]TWE18763.1 hypothetical protein FB465_3852 [Kitasatospora atroaurantiaca]
MTDTTETTEPTEPTEPIGSIEPTAPADPWALPTTAAAPPVGDAWAVSAEVLSSEEARKPRRAALLRWGAAALILLLSGTAAAVAVTAPERTKIPGLETPNDGRYAFPQLTLPPLPSGKPAPHASGTDGRHYADLRQLLLTPPKGATVSAASAAASPAPSSSASASATAAPTATAAAADAADWVPCTGYAARDKDPAKFNALLAENACRAATKRVWTTPDGTRTEIWLLRFGSAVEAGAFYLKMNQGDLKDVPGLEYAYLSIAPSVDSTSSTAFTKTTAGSKNEPVGRVAYVQASDIAAAVVMTNPQGVPVQAFRQVTILQNNMLH